MAKIINKRNVIGDRFKEAVASLISFTPTTTITGTNVQAALEEVDTHVLASTAISDDEFEATEELPRDADTLCGMDGNEIISDLSELSELNEYEMGTSNLASITYTKIGHMVTLHCYSVPTGTNTISGVPKPKNTKYLFAPLFSGSTYVGQISFSNGVSFQTSVSSTNGYGCLTYICE